MKYTADNYNITLFIYFYKHIIFIMHVLYYLLLNQYT